MQDHVFSNLLPDEMLENIDHDQKRMKQLEGALLEKIFDFDNLYTISKKSKFAFFFSETIVFLSVQLEPKNAHFQFTNDDLLMIN